MDPRLVLKGLLKWVNCKALDLLYSFNNVSGSIKEQEDIEKFSVQLLTHPSGVATDGLLALM